MAEFKSMIVKLPEEMLADIDRFAANEKQSRNQFVQDAMGTYLERCRHRALVAHMKQGYEEMGALNLLLAEEGLRAEMAGPEACL